MTRLELREEIRRLILFYDLHGWDWCAAVAYLLHKHTSSF